GILVPPADTRALAEAIAGLLDNPDRRRQLSEEGQRRIINMFDWRNTAKHTVDVYREAIEHQKIIEAQ
ncbi:MAG: glycosyltransferase, partial [Dehalococcoidia bacterium]|nr:glycosyltransferase [Dehalococcoidia bacterium]